MSPDGRYLDADPVALDLVGLSLDVLRESRVGDLAPPDLRDANRRMWDRWIASGDTYAEAEGTFVRSDGAWVRAHVTMVRQDDGSVLLHGIAIDGLVAQPPAMKVQALLGRWRALERQLNDLGPDDPDRAVLRSRIEALREEYQRRVTGKK